MKDFIGVIFINIKKMSEISKTGYWNGETAHQHHVHSEKLSEWICNFMQEKGKMSVVDYGCINF